MHEEIEKTKGKDKSFAKSCGDMASSGVMCMARGCCKGGATLLVPPGRDEYFLVNLGSMSAQESTHRALCIIKTSFCALLVKVFFLLWSKVLIPAGRIGGDVAFRRLLQWCCSGQSKTRCLSLSLSLSPSFKRPVRAILFPPTCLRRMHPRPTLEAALARLSLLIDFEIISANHHP
jgi:hypothetical protein